MPVICRAGIHGIQEVQEWPSVHLLRWTASDQAEVVVAVRSALVSAGVDTKQYSG